MPKAVGLYDPANEHDACGVAMVATLPELMPADVAAELMAGGVVPMSGLSEAIAAAAVAATLRKPEEAMVLLPGHDREGILVDEGSAKAALAACGVAVPPGRGRRIAWRYSSGSTSERCHLYG